MITTEKLKSFKEQLSITTQLVDDLLRTRTPEKLFKNSADYYDSLANCEMVPQDFYRLRIFDTEIFLKFNFRTKHYYIYIETLKHEFFRKITFNEFMTMNKLKMDQFEKQIIFPLIPFREIVPIFCEFCVMFLKLYINTDKLFIYNN